MKANEIFLISVGFVLLFIVFCFVNLTGNDPDDNVNIPIHRLKSASAATGNHRAVFQSSVLNPDHTTQKPKTNNTAQAAEKHPVNARTNVWSSRFREFNKENNTQLKTVISNGRVYFENTSGVEACEEEDNNDEGNIEIIE
jgi:hypothetical protein